MAFTTGKMSAKQRPAKVVIGIETLKRSVGAREAQQIPHGAACGVVQEA